MKAKFVLLARVSGQYVNVDFRNGNPVPPPGASSYYVRFSAHGARHTKPLGHDFQTAVLEVKNLTLGREAQKLGLAAPPTLIIKEKSLAIRAQKYLAEIEANKAHATYVAYAFAVTKFLAFCERSKLDAVTRADMLEFKHSLRKEYDSERSVFNHFTVAVVFLKWAEMPVTLKAGDWPKPNLRDPEEYFEEQIAALLTHANSSERLLVNALACSGVRSGELQHLTYGDVDFRYSNWTIRPKVGWKTKTENAKRDIPIPAWLNAQIAERMKDLKKTNTDTIFFRASGKPYEGDGLLRVIKNLGKRAGLTGRVDVHKFRSTAISRWLRAGNSVTDIMRWVGHSNPATIMHYAAKANLRRPEVHERATSAFASFAGVGD